MSQHALSKMFVAIVVLALAVSSAAAQTILYVDHDAPGADNGTSWPDAYHDLQDALAAVDTNGTDAQIRVAAGTYAPTGGVVHEYSTYQLINGVTLLGGYAGHGAPDPDLRDLATHRTVLANEGVHNTVTGSGCDRTAVLDGFTIVGEGAAGCYSSWYGGGGGIYNLNGSPTIRHCSLLNHCEQGSGSAVHNEHSQAVFESCVFSGNHSERSAGAVYNYYSRPTFTNCTFSLNSADDAPGAFWDEHSSSTLTNCIFWKNTADWNSYFSIEEIQFLSRNGAPNLTNCCIEGWSGVWGGESNFGDDPLFIDADGPDNLPGTIDDDVHLLPDSPCINAGTDAAALTSLDFDGQARVQHCRVDIGADESADYPEDCNANTTADACDLADGTSSDCNQNATPDECESTQDCDTNGIQDICELAGHDWNRNGILDRCDIAAGTSTDADGDSIPDDAVMYVDADAPGPHDGSSWERAYLTVSTALPLACADGSIAQVRVAEGNYLTTNLEPCNGVALLGGYAGYGAPDPNLRDFAARETVLDADSNGPVISNVLFYGAYTYTYAPSDASAVLDGFTITGGHTSETYSRSGGGGVQLGFASPTIRNCTFRDNTAKWDGAGLCTYYGHPKLINCTFENNRAGHDGGGLANHEGYVTLIDCTFTGNVAANDGGGLYVNEYWGRAGLTLRNCVFHENSADPAYGFGGAVRVRGQASISNCIFGANLAFSGAGVYSAWGDADITNSTFYGNRAIDDGAGAFGFGLDGGIALTNCILWGNESTISADLEDAQAAAWSGLLAIARSCLEGLDDYSTNGVGNLDDTPGFADAFGTDGLPGTADDDLRLSAESPMIDAGDNTAVPNDVADLDHDGDTAERTPLDLDGNPRFLDDPQTRNTGVADRPDYRAMVDLGPFEFFPDCNTNSVPDGWELGSVLPSGALTAVSVGGSLPTASGVSLMGPRTRNPCLRRENDQNGNCVLDACE
ncbi:MAG: right-handed parallel beta-helix repeat-containing protein [bacterium]|nr:right-handed parallel beta-helix repeat-containing protein [bacterium]